jgi:glucose/arabinose dehydrogenase
MAEFSKQHSLNCENASKVPFELWTLPTTEYGTGRASPCRRAIGPALTFDPHASVINIRFYYVKQFPEQYRDDAFVTLRVPQTKPIAGDVR